MLVTTFLKAKIKQNFEDKWTKQELTTSAHKKTQPPAMYYVFLIYQTDFREHWVRIKPPVGHQWHA